MKKQENEGIRVRSTPAFKLKDKVGRQFQAINLEKQFGFVPKVIIVEKVLANSNTLIVRAVLTDEEIIKEDKQIKNLEATKPKDDSNGRTDTKSNTEDK